MELFRTYTKDYREIIEEARSKIEQASTLDGDERRAKLREAESALGDAEHIVRIHCASCGTVIGCVQRHTTYLEENV